MPRELNEEEIKDIEERKALFKAAHARLVEEHQIDMTAYPMWVPFPDMTFHTIVRMDYADLKYRNPSPLANLQ